MHFVNYSGVCISNIRFANAGRYEGRICEGIYTDVSSASSRLYAAMFGALSKSRVQVYNEKADWALLRTIKLPVDGMITLKVSIMTKHNFTERNLFLDIRSFHGQIFRILTLLPG